MNRLLTALNTDDRDLLLTASEELNVETGRLLHEAGQPMECAYFPCDAVISQAAVHDGAGAVETGTVGREGVLAITALNGDGVAFERSVVQVPGRVTALPIEAVRQLFDRSTTFRRVLGAYAQAYAAQVSQSVLCNATHASEARLSRWLLMCLDRTNADRPLPLDARFLAEMLGIGRPAVTVVAGTLQTAGLIRKGPDGIAVIDRSGLEEAACDCYRRVREAFERVLPGSYS